MALVCSIGGLLLGCVLLASNAQAQTIFLKTEDHPPFNMVDESEHVVGLATDIVRQLFERAEIGYTIELLSREQAIAITLEERNTAVFSISRTADLEDQFKWVGPLVQHNWVLFAKEERAFVLSSLDEAKKFRIGGTYGDGVSQYLKNQSFELDLVSKNHLNLLKLDRGRLDLWATGEIFGRYETMRHNIKDIEPAYILKYNTMDIAFNKDTNSSLIEHLNHVLNTMRTEGIIAEIMEKYQ